VDGLDRPFLLNVGQAVGLLALGVGLLGVTATHLRSRTPIGPGQRAALSVGGAMLLIAWIGVFLGVGQWFHVNFATVYAPSYSEDRFVQIRIGMTRQEVGSLLGPPLRKTPKPSETWQPDGIWVYSEPSGPGRLGDNYWRRWVVFNPGETGKVIAIVNDYYVD
jgi:hypothetical protein